MKTSYFSVIDVVSIQPTWKSASTPAFAHMLRASVIAVADGAGVGARSQAMGVERDGLGVAHEIAPRLHHLHLVTALAKALGHRSVEARLEPHRRRWLAPGAAEEPAWRLHRGLRAEPAV